MDRYWFFFIITNLIYLCRAANPVRAPLFGHQCVGITKNSHLVWKREVPKQCSIPAPLEHGQFRVNPRTCPSEDRRAICHLLPGTKAPDLWVLYYSCHADYELSTTSGASVCRGGQWLPSLPVCVPNLNFITRREWGSGADNAQFLPQVIPNTRVIVAHTATPPCGSRTQCVLTTQSIQQHHVQQYGDIGYNFLVGGDGSVLEGQGWDKIGAHTINYNTHSVCIALIGNYVDTPAPQPMLTAVKRLIERGVALGKLTSDYKLYAHCQLIQVASPGRKVFDEIIKWPNWDPKNALPCYQ